jgi:hypothetical protein
MPTDTFSGTDAVQRRDDPVDDGRRGGAAALGLRARRWVVWGELDVCARDGRSIDPVCRGESGDARRFDSDHVPVVLAAFLFVYGSAAVVLPERVA